MPDPIVAEFTTPTQVGDGGTSQSTPSPIHCHNPVDPSTLDDDALFAYGRALLNEFADALTRALVARS